MLTIKTAQISCTLTETHTFDVYVQNYHLQVLVIIFYSKNLYNFICSRSIASCNFLSTLPKQTLPNKHTGLYTVRIYCTHKWVEHKLGQTVLTKCMCCVFFLGPAKRHFCPGALRTVWSKWSLPGPAAGQQSCRAPADTLPTSRTSAGPGGGSKPSGCAETGNDTLQEDAGEDDGTTGRCREQT